MKFKFKVGQIIGDPGSVRGASTRRWRVMQTSVTPEGRFYDLQHVVRGALYPHRCADTQESFWEVIPEIQDPPTPEQAEKALAKNIMAGIKSRQFQGPDGWTFVTVRDVRIVLEELTGISEKELE